MLQMENLLRAERNDLENELALLGSFLTGLGLEESLAGKIMQRAVYESIETGRPTIDILHEYRDKLRMGYTWR